MGSEPPPLAPIFLKFLPKNDVRPTQICTSYVPRLVVAFVLNCFTFISRYRWAFTGDPGVGLDSLELDNQTVKQLKESSPGFLPHVFRINRLMNLRVSMRLIKA